jgi:hypothetical protein
MRGIYIHTQEGDKVWGHILWMCHGRWTVSKFSDCTLSLVVDTASRRIHEPKVYRCEDDRFAPRSEEDLTGHECLDTYSDLPPEWA